MTQQIINVGTGPDSYTGDTLRTAFEKTNENFNELYTLVGDGQSGNLTANTITVTGNVTATRFIGDGSLLTGITATSNYSNSNVASYLTVYSGNVNAAYYFGNGRNLTGITTTANLGNITIGGTLNQTLIGSAAGTLAVRPFAGNAFVVQTEYDSSGVLANLIFQTTVGNTIQVSPGTNATGFLPSLRLGANAASIIFDAQNNIIGFNGTPNAGYDFTFNNGSLYATEFYAEAGFPTGYQFNTPGGLTGMNHIYQNDINGNVSVVKISHDNSTPAKFYENNTTLLSGNLVVLQSGSNAGTFPNAFVQTYSTANSYTQFIWQNLGTGTASTGDIVVTSDSGSDTTNYIDMGMTNSNYDNTNPSNSLGTSVGLNDGYLYVKGAADTLSGNLTIGTVDAGTVTKIIAGGVDAANVVAAFGSNNISFSTGNNTWQFYSNGALGTQGGIIAASPHGTIKLGDFSASSGPGLSSSTGFGLKIDDGVGYPQWYFGSDGKLSTPGNVLVTGGNGLVSSGNVTVAASNSIWSFNVDNSLTAPGDITSLSGNILVKNIRTTDGTVHVGQGAGLTNQGTYSIAMGRFAGSQDQGAAGIAIGQLAGQTNQGQTAIALGFYAAQNTQSANAVAIGTFAGQSTQGENAVAVGILAGNTSQGNGAVAIGPEAGKTSQGIQGTAIGIAAGSRSQGNGSVAVGSFAGQYDQKDFAIAIGSGAAASNQGYGAIAIGVESTTINQGDYSIAIGFTASNGNIQPNNSIIIDATNSQLAATGPGLFVSPVRAAEGANVSLSYNTATKEITYSANTFVSNTYVPSTAGSAGTIGQISFDGSFVYICVGTDTWKRANLATW